MTVDLKSMNKKQLEKLKGQIDKQLEKLAAQDMKAARDAAEKAAKAHGYSLADIVGTAGPAKPTSKRRSAKPTGNVNPPKYRNPENAAQTWTGKGRRPEWIKAAQEKGIDIETMAI